MATAAKTWKGKGVVENRRRRDSVGGHGLRSRPRPAVLRHRQRLHLVPAALRGEGDSLYTACILAVNASTGALVWHFQTTPGDSFDYDATQPLVQADLALNGRPRKVLLQANKNGFFSHVLDRQTGEVPVRGTVRQWDYVGARD